MSESPVTITLGAGKLVKVLDDGTEVELGSVSDFKITLRSQPEVLVGEIDLEVDDGQEA